MFGEGRIKNIIKYYVERGEKKYIIYPYGANGLMVNNILKSYFGLSPVYIVDNVYCQYNSSLINVSRLKEVYKPDMYIFLTIENDVLNKRLYEELSEFVPLENIVNLLDRTKIISANVKVDEQFDLKCILPDLHYTIKENKSNYCKKIKVRIFHNSICTWNAIESICRAFGEDEEIELKIIISCQKIDAAYYRFNKASEQAEKKGYVCVSEEDYDVAIDRPDILFLVHPDFTTKEAPFKYRKFVKMIFVAQMSLIRYDCASSEEFIKIMNDRFMGFRPDYWLYDSLLYHEVKDCKLNCGKIVEMGNAAFDNLYEACANPTIPLEWEKIRNRKCICWTTDHGIYGGIITKQITFDLYAKRIFKYAKDNPDIGVIFRPHSSFIEEMLKNFYWSQEEFEELKQYINQTDNIVFDELDTYAVAFSVADAILMDGFGGILCAALPTLKPVGVMYRERGDDWLHPEITENYYKIFSETELNEFMDRVLNEEIDSKYEARKEASIKFVKHFDGNNGFRIREYVKQEFHKYVR